METGLVSGVNAGDQLVLCSQDGFLTHPFVSNDYSTDSSSSQLTGGLASVQNYGHPSPALVNGQQHQAYRPQELRVDAEALGYFDESSGMYVSPQIQSQGPFVDCRNPIRGLLPPFRPASFNYSPYSDATGSSSGAGVVTKDTPVFIPNVCQDPAVDLSPWSRLAPAQFNMENAVGNKFAFPDFNQSLMARPRGPVSGILPSLAEQSLTLDPQAPRCKTGSLDPTLATTTTKWWNGGTSPSIKEENQTTKEVQSPQILDCSYTASKSRWKPNVKQLCYLEQHFRTGFTKTTPELFKEVKEVGPATESQVAVWLKNRLARCKRHVGKEIEFKSEEGSNCEGESLSPTISGNKRERQEEDMSEDFMDVQTAVLDELSGILQSVDCRDIKGLARAIRDANHICCYGVNGEGLAMKTLALKLFHLGFKVHCVGDITAPSLTKGDLLLVAAGPSYYSTVSALALEAMRSGTRVIAFTAHKTAPLPFAESVIRIASQTLPPCMPVMNRKLGGVASEVVSSLPEGRFSCMPMGGSFEVALSFVLESLCVMLRKKLGISATDSTLR